MLTNTNKATYPSSTSKHSEASAGSCSPLKKGLPRAEDLGQTSISDGSAGMKAAQKLIAEIAVRIITAKKGGNK